MNERNVEQFEALLSRFSDAALNDAELAELGRLIACDRALRGRYLDYCQMHAMLRAEHGLLASWGVIDDDGLVRPASTMRAWPFRRSLTFWLSAAVLATVALGVWTYSLRDVGVPASKPSQPYRGKVVAQLLKQVHAEFAYGPRGETTPPVGSAIPQGTYELTNGIIEIQSSSGALLTIEAPASFTLADDKCVRMDHGRLAAHIPKKAIGFRVETASATVIDLGTDFAVEAITGKNSEVHVFKGEVRIDLHGSKATSARPLHLTTGRAARIDFLTGMPSGIDLDEQRFLRRLEVDHPTYRHQVLALQPAVYYPMDPVGDGMHLRDLSPNGTHAQIVLGRASEPVWAPGKFGLAFSLGGPAQQTYAAAPAYQQADGDRLSVVAWVTARSRPRWASIAKNWAGADDRGQFHFGLCFDSGELEAHIEDSSGEEIVVKDSVPLPLHEWHHVAFVADGSMLRLYRNGQQVDATAYRELHRDPRIKALAVGTKLSLNGEEPDSLDFNMWDGRLDELAIFNHALSPEQIRHLFDLGSAESRGGP
jgi:hypothetical protein